MSDETDRAKNYADWNNRPKMDAAEFAKWQEEWYARERAESLDIATAIARGNIRIARIRDEIIFEPLGTDIDLWFLKACGISL